MNRPRLSDSALKIALAEYELLREVRTATQDIIARRFGYYSGSLSIVGAGVALLASQVENTVLSLQLTGCLAAAFLILGLGVFARLVELRNNTTIYTRGLNALRSILLSSAPELRGSFILPTDRSRPDFKPAGRGLLLASLAGNVAMTNSLVAGLVFGIIAFLAAGSVPISALSGTLGFALCLFAQLKYERSESSRVESEYSGQPVSKAADIGEHDGASVVGTH